MGWAEQALSIHDVSESAQLVTGAVGKLST